jgi:hypothetical protein
MNIEQIMLDVQKEFESSGLSDGLCGDFAREVAKRAVAAEREECAKVCDDRAKDEPGKLPKPQAYKDEALLCAAYIRARSNAKSNRLAGDRT